MADCSSACGLVLADIPKPSQENCKNVYRSNEWKGFLFQVCQTTTDDVTPLPAWNSTIAVKQAWLTSQEDTFTSVHKARNIIVNEPETTDVKLIQCLPPSKVVTKQIITFEEAIVQASKTDAYLYLSILRIPKVNISGLNVIGVKCNNDLYPFVCDFDSAAPKFATANGKFSSVNDALGDSSTLEVKKGELYFYCDVLQFNTPYIEGSSVPDGFINKLLP